MKALKRAARLSVIALLMLVGIAHAFDGPGHYKATLIAVQALPQDVPSFFRTSTAEIASGSMDPDVFKVDSLPPLRKGEYPEHYFDMEPLKGAAIPPNRYDFIQFCAKQNLAPDKIGTLPYALVEWTQRLTVAFAQYRRWPDDLSAQHKCLVYAGILAHYAEDACQPLHTTIDYDGRTSESGKSPRSGIHAKVDALIEKVEIDPKIAATALKPASFDALWPAIVKQLQNSYSLVDKTYDLEKEYPSRYEPLRQDTKVAEFAKDRLFIASQFTAALYLTAWKDSANLEIPAWHIREHDRAREISTSQPAKQAAK